MKSYNNRIVENNKFSKYLKSQEYEIIKILPEIVNGETNYLNYLHFPQIDVNDIILKLRNLRMKDGYKLHYFYYYDFISGIPYVYASEISNSIYKLNDINKWGNNIYPNKIEKSISRQFLDYIETDRTPISYFQLALLCIYCDHYFHIWHANNRDEIIVCTQYKLSEIHNYLSSNGSISNKLNNDLVRVYNDLNLLPSVKIKADQVEVSFYYFTVRGGLFKVEWIISNEDLHEIEFKRTNIVEYEYPLIY